MSNTENGSAAEGTLILIGLIIILVFFVLPQSGVIGPATSFNNVTNPTTYHNYAASRSQGVTGLITNSAYSGDISIGQGNAAYTIEPLNEYITIENDGIAPVNITGWKLMNNKSNHVYYAGSQKVTYASDVATIPQASGYISPSGFNLPQNVILKPGETAVVTSGASGIQTPYRITSFKENECSGYLEALPQYDFTPSLSYMCVPPSQEPGVDTLDRSCKDFLTSLSSCQTPTFGKTDPRASDNCSNCVNGRPAPSDACFHFIQEHYSYAGCLNYHENDPTFYGTTWRIFLGRQWEMWDKQDEIISLFDQYGKLAAYKGF